jgi:hypothetical protein
MNAWTRYTVLKRKNSMLSANGITPEEVDHSPAISVQMLSLDGQ